MKYYYDHNKKKKIVIMDYSHLVLLILYIYKYIDKNIVPTVKQLQK